MCGENVEDDGMTFLADTIRVERIRDEEAYEGVRVLLEARLANARIPLPIDVGFGDVIPPAPVEVEYPALLTFLREVLLEVSLHDFRCSAELALEFFRIMTTAPPFSRSSCLVGARIRVLGYRYEVQAISDRIANELRVGGTVDDSHCGQTVRMGRRFQLVGNELPVGSSEK